MIAARNNGKSGKKESVAAWAFRSVFSDEEWAEMKASDIAGAEESQYTKSQKFDIICERLH